ncbi:MAG: hypothetical protein OHK0038_17090 [Flammeovirgaceae bacterium]
MNCINKYLIIEKYYYPKFTKTMKKSFIILAIIGLGMLNSCVTRYKSCPTYSSVSPKNTSIEVWAKK